MNRYIINDDNSVTDTRTGLIWTRNTLTKGVDYADAEKAVAALGHGWRLPTVHELSSLVDHIRHDPAIDAEAFPDTRSRAYWSSTPCAWDAAAMWVVHFDYGHTDGYDRHCGAYVRAVRDVAAVEVEG